MLVLRERPDLAMHHSSNRAARPVAARMVPDATPGQALSGDQPHTRFGSILTETCESSSGRRKNRYGLPVGTQRCRQLAECGKRRTCGSKSGVRFLPT